MIFVWRCGRAWLPAHEIFSCRFAARGFGCDAPGPGFFALRVETGITDDNEKDALDQDVEHPRGCRLAEPEQFRRFAAGKTDLAVIDAVMSDPDLKQQCPSGMRHGPPGATLQQVVR
jgi:hypothetical protein